LVGEDCCILHYVCCGLPWLKSKYQILGDFEDAWFGGRLPIAPSFHLDARDAFKHSTIDDIWKTQVVFRNENNVLEKHLNSGVLLRILKPRNILLNKATSETSNETSNETSSEITTGGMKIMLNSGEQKEEQVEAAATDNNATTADKDVPTADTFTYSKAWMMSQAVQHFL
jgi:hypothetical protein